MRHYNWVFPRHLSNLNLAENGVNSEGAVKLAEVMAPRRNPDGTWSATRR